MKDWTVPSSQLLLLGFLKHLYPWNYLHVTTSPCSVLHHTIRTRVSHYPWALSPSKYDIGIMHKLTFSWQKLWGLSVIWEVMQFSLAVRYQGFAKTCCLWLHLGDDNSRFLHQTILQHIPEHSNLFEIQNIWKLYFHRLFWYLNYFSHASILKQPCCKPQEMIYPGPHSKFPSADRTCYHWVWQMNAKEGEKEDQWYMVHRYIKKKNW